MQQVALKIDLHSYVDEIRNKVICSDCLSEMKKIPTDSIDLIITSPPYDDLRTYNNSTIWNHEIFKPIAREMYRIMKPGGTVVWVVGDKTENGNKSATSFRQALYFQEIGFFIFDTIIYEKTGSGPPHPNRYFNSFEYMFVLSKDQKPKTINLLRDKKNKHGGSTTFGEVTRREKDGSLTNKGKKTIQEYGIRTNIWRYSNGKGFSTKDKVAYEHPAIFPEKLAEDHILSWSDEGDIVLDPFGGSGTTCKMAKRLQRSFIYIDKVPEYCEIATKRINSSK